MTVQTAQYLRFALALIAGACIYAACSDSSEEKPIGGNAMTRSVPFSTPTEYSVRKTDIQRMDVNGDGFEDALLMIFPKDSLDARIGFEVLRIYEYDSLKNQFSSAFEGKYFYGKTVEQRDLDNNGKAELCIRTDGGGNSAIASRGMSVVGKQAGKYITLASFDFGNPDFVMLMGDSSKGISNTMALVSNDEYFPEYLPPTETVIVPDSIVVFAATPEAAFRQRLEYIQSAAEKAQNRYNDAVKRVQNNRSEQALFTVYSEAVITMRLLGKLSTTKQLQDFIAKERPFWRASLPKRFHNALDDLFRQHP